MNSYFDNLAKLGAPDAATLNTQAQLTGPGGILVLYAEPDPPLEGVPYIRADLATETTAPPLLIQIGGVVHTLGGASETGGVGELEFIAEGETVTVDAGSQLLLHGQLTVEGTLVLDGTLVII